MSPEEPRLRARTVFLSDVHLGFDGCKAEALLSFLRVVDTPTLYLVGDIIDLASGSLDWPEAHCEVVREILSIADRGTRVVYIPGNHDFPLRALHGTRFGNVEIRRDALHETADGRRFLVMHGDEFDSGGLAKPWLEALGGRAYGVLLGLDRHLTKVGTPLGLPQTSIAASLKQRVKARVQGAGFEQSLSAEARQRGVDGLICGHVHRAEIVDLDGVLYCNDGDWVESCTALVEDSKGTLSLVHGPEVQRLASLEPTNTDVEKAA